MACYKSLWVAVMMAVVKRKNTGVEKYNLPCRLPSNVLLLDSICKMCMLQGNLQDHLTAGHWINSSIERTKMGELQGVNDPSFAYHDEMYSSPSGRSFQQLKQWQVYYKFSGR